MFDRFYKGDKTVGAQDIEKIYSKMIKQEKALNLIGAEAQAEFIVYYGVTKITNPKEFKRVKKIARDYLEKIKEGEIIDTGKVAQETNIDIRYVNIALLESKKFEYIKYGQYKKLSSN